MAKFNALDHIGHSLYGTETVDWSGTIHMTPGVHTPDWWAGRNLSDAEQVSVKLEGCYDCDVEFEDDDT